MRGNLLFKAIDRFLGVPLLALAGLVRSRAAVPPLQVGGRVLVVKFSAMGDTLLLLPLLKALRQHLGPQGRLEMVATPVNAGVLKGLGWVNTVHIFDPKELFKRPWKILGLLFKLRQARFIHALDFDQWLRSAALLSLASGARWRVGFKTPGQAKHLAFHASAANHREGHEFEQFKAVAALAGLDASTVEPFGGFLLKEKFLGAEVQKRGPAPLVLLHPGTGGSRGWQREWPVERFSALAVRLRKERGAHLCLSGAGSYELSLCDAIDRGMEIPAEERSINGGLRQLVTDLCRADLVVCGNTGVMHLAAGLGRPLVALHGPNPHVKWGPLAQVGMQEKTKVLLASTACSPCLNLGHEFGCKLRPCMESIPVEAVTAASASILEVKA